jgi:hypothetical protein
MRPNNREKIDILIVRLSARMKKKKRSANTERREKTSSEQSRQRFPKT